MAVYHVAPAENTLHGYFSRELPPILTIESGDTVHFQTLDAGWGTEPPTPGKSERQRQKFPRRKYPYDLVGHALCGPIAIRGAMPGMTLEVQIGAVRTGAWGWNWVGAWSNPVFDAFGLADQPEHLLLWDLDHSTQTATDQYGHRLMMRPFFGVMGMPPPEPGPHSTIPPRIWGGNLDCRELVAGTRLFLPIPVEGALFSAGDGHAAQADGEVSLQGIECPIEDGALTFVLHEGLSLETPRARTAHSWLTFGFHSELFQATMIALRAMITMMEAEYHVDTPTALNLASLVVDMRITQIANQVMGVHAVLEDDKITTLAR